MQYVLSQEEYDALNSRKSALVTEIKDDFIKFVDIAIEDSELRCIYQPQHSSLNIMYCDDCPLQSVCPKQQEYSQ